MFVKETGKLEVSKSLLNGDLPNEQGEILPTMCLPPLLPPLATQPVTADGNSWRQITVPWHALYVMVM